MRRAAGIWFGVVFFWGVYVHLVGETSGLGYLLCGFSTLYLMGPGLGVGLLCLRSGERVGGLFAGLSLLIAATADGFSFSGPSGAADFRVLTLNCAHGAAGYVRIEKTLLELDPQILILQESGPPDHYQGAQKAALARILEKYPGGRTLFEATGSRWPMISKEVIDLSASPMDWENHPPGQPWKHAPKQMLVTKFQSPRGPVTVLNVHLSPFQYERLRKDPWRRLDQLARARTAQYDGILSYLESHTGERIILGGDFNGAPKGPRYRELTRRLKDHHQQAGRGRGITVPDQRRVDYVWSRGFQVAEHFAWGNWELSDHRPVVSGLRW